MNFENPKKNQYFEKMKKIAGGIIILQMCTKKRYSSWDKSEKECFVILGHFLSFYPLPFICSFIPFWPRKLKFGKM